MKALLDPQNALTEGLADIRRQFQLAGDFPPDVTASAQEAARRALNGHTDRTALPFVTLDPATSTDLDQAFTIEQAGADLLLRYAIADIAWFVDKGSAIDTEAWKRGASQYLPDGKIRLYPAILSDGAASLLPDGPRPAIIFTVRLGTDGKPKLDGVERALIRSSAKLAYDSVREADLPGGFAEFARRMSDAEERRGASRVDPPEQEVSRDGNGRFTLRFRPRLPSEDQNAALSLATNLAVADALLAHKTGLFRVMPGPDDKAIARLRQTARALELTWPCMATLTQFERSLDGANPRHAAFMLAVRRAGDHASYQPYEPGEIPWHAAVGATYAHVTAPLRRLADRYVIEAALAIANGQSVPEEVEQAFTALPEVMAGADRLGGQIERAAIDLAEAVILDGREGELFTAVITDTDERGVLIQLKGLPIVARIKANAHQPGDEMQARLTDADPAKRSIRFEPA